MVAWRYCARPHAVGAWVTNPFKKDTAAPNPGQLVEEQASDHDSLAMVDPLVGLASMQVSLHDACAAHAAPVPLLTCLQRQVCKMHSVADPQIGYVRKLCQVLFHSSALCLQATSAYQVWSAANTLTGTTLMLSAVLFATVGRGAG